MVYTLLPHLSRSSFFLLPQGGDLVDLIRYEFDKSRLAFGRLNLCHANVTEACIAAVCAALKLVPIVKELILNSDLVSTKVMCNGMHICISLCLYIYPPPSLSTPLRHPHAFYDVYISLSLSLYLTLSIALSLSLSLSLSHPPTTLSLLPILHLLKTYKTL